MQTPKLLLQFLLNIYPPLFFNRIIVKKISADFLNMNVIIKKSMFNINLYRTIFGGSIFAACDPFFPIMYYHIFKKKNRKLTIWLKSAEIKYLEPANTSLNLRFKITQNDITFIEESLNKNGKCEIWNKINAKNKNGIICTKARMLIYLRETKK